MTMNNFINIVQNIIEIICSKQFLLCTEIVSFIVALSVGCILIKLYLQQNIYKQKSTAFYLLLIVVISFSLENLSWIFKLLYMLDISPIKNYTYIQIFILIAWIVNIILYQSFGLFIENIIENKFRLKLHNKIFIVCTGIFTFIFAYTAYVYFMNKLNYLMLYIMVRVAICYRPLLIIPAIIITLYSLYYKKIPTILKKQITIFLQVIIFPLITSDLIQCIPFFFDKGATADTLGIMAVIFPIYMIVAIIFCARNLMRFRFFNLSHKVQDKNISDLGGDLKDTIAKISLAQSQQELIYIIEVFFKETFNIPAENIYIHFRYKQGIKPVKTFFAVANNSIESFLSKDDDFIDLLQQYRILVADEIAFDAYYNDFEHDKKLVTFLDSIDSEIFLPMYDQNTIIAYLIVRRNKKHKFYSASEQNKIIIFGTFLASAINIMHKNSMITLLQENKTIKEDLYLKHQEINQYKESIKTLLKQKANFNVGILLYKDDRFSFSNETAQTLLPLSLNHPRKHPVAIALAHLAEQVEAFRTVQTRMLHDNQNRKLLVTGVPHLDYQGGVILTIYYPDSSDIIKAHIDKLQDSSQLDYLLYLETTKSGKLVNQLIPSSHETVLNFKIKLLQIALSKKAALLLSHDEDLMTIVELIHRISSRTALHILDLKPTLVTHDLAVNLFGLNPLLLLGQEQGLLAKLDQNGTLFIKNVELLDLDTQNKLANFIKYGMFTLMKSEQRVFADVRIICSVGQNPKFLVEQNKLSTALYNELSQTTLQMPSLSTIDENELEELIDQLTYQVTEHSHFAHIISMSKKEKNELIHNMPESLQGFILKVKHMLAKKFQEYNIVQKFDYVANNHVTDPKLLKAANLGKHALKDSQMMSMLWSQFKCQNKIALFLGVNRSSVQRRCKEYNLS